MLDATLFLLQPGNLALGIAAVLAGIIVGAIPGITSTIAIGVMIPLTFTMEKSTAFIAMIGIFSGAMYGGSISAILMNMPGTPTAAITAIDGFPLTRRGEGGRALGVSALASAIGGVIGCVALILLAPQLSAVALAFSGPEYFSLCVFALVVVAALASADALKGAMSVGLGLLLGCVGIDPTTPYPRFTFGISELAIGVPEVPATIGLFCVAEAFRMVYATGEIERFRAVGFNLVEAGRDCFRHWWIILKASIIGTVIGILPATGSVSAAFLGYAEAKRASRRKHEFGHGSIEGIAAAEASNNAVVGGALIPTLTLGIPGDTNTLMIMGAMFVQGLVPGPTLFREEPFLINVIFVTTLLANLLIVPVALYSNWIARLAGVKINYLLPVVLVLCVAGPSLSYGHIYYFWITIGFGLVGLILGKTGFSVLGVGLGLILEPTLESSLRSAMMLPNAGWQMFATRPLSLLFLILAALVVYFGFLARRLNVSSSMKEA
jgi:putative tricarboxylic transport membrane protein